MPLLALENVGKNFGGIEAVKRLSLQIPAGCITGLIGPNGAGKTTVVNLITGVLKLSSGMITLDGVDISQAPPHEVARAGISRTFQNIRLLATATVLENVMVGLHRREAVPMVSCLLGLPDSRRETKWVRQESEKLLEQFQMTRFADYPAGELAYGHQRRVEIMRAVAMQPKILLLDEPVAGMNDVEAHDLGRVFKKLAHAGMGLLLIEHNVRFVSRICENVCVLDSGRSIALGRPSP
jgi:branched-chain amino acid transport system ATP-binding protein